MCTEVDGRPLRGPNDLVFDADGGCYFTDFGNTRAREMDLGGLYYALPTAPGWRNWCSRCTSRTASACPRTEIGCTSPKPGRAGCGAGGAGAGPRCAAVPSCCTGSPWRGCWIQLAVDTAGNVCVATLNTGEISVLSPDGELVEQVPVPVPDPLVTNICFGGPDLAHRLHHLLGPGRAVRDRVAAPRAWPRTSPLDVPPLPPRSTSCPRAGMDSWCAQSARPLSGRRAAASPPTGDHRPAAQAAGRRRADPRR
ncbi:SMP-30/gluconolactonase/LRE family protein [Saccharopolyspora gregorii]|uniref:SMP-30/Gluconolactonase/LRE-like region domain-containing protein n=1 Tax=Saccharopolyspora gregorii TaxID=33914 RepID=A0ABP6S324_9PSEU